MSDTKFTKGDWEISSCGLVINVNGYKVARAHSGVGVPYTLPSKANAQLIAAAPEMYKALEDAAREIHILIEEVNDQRVSNISSVTETEPDYYDMESVHSIQVLLAKARGEL